MDISEAQIVERSPREQLRLQWKEYRGRLYFDARIYFLPKGEEEWQATRKGFSVKPEHFTSFGAGLQVLFDATPKEVKEVAKAAAAKAKATT